VSALSEDEVETLLANFINLHFQIMLLDEEQVAQLIEAEVAGRCRATFVKRLYHRSNKLRGEKEWSILQTRMQQRHATLRRS
jgi:hypothetical protein